MIVIIDYQCGNPASIHNMLKKIGCPAQISSDPTVIRASSKLILPGVGSFDHGMNKLEEFGLLPVLQERVAKDKIPILGICLGVQLFCARSDEGKRSGLGWIDANVVKFDSTRMRDTDKIPHMGWIDTYVSRATKLISSEDETPRYYFVHSYHLDCRNQSQIMATASHGYEFVAAVEKDNILGVQFHPEKSHRYGKELMKKFIEQY